MENIILFVIQARLGSSRLPEKVLKPIGTWNSIEILVRRLSLEWPLENIVFAIPNTLDNIPLEKTLKTLGVKIQKGSENDVYQRYFDALSNKNNPFFIRLTADCPLISVELIKEGIDKFLTGNYDIVHSGQRAAEGLDFEIIDRGAFINLANHNLLDIQREHPTLYFYQNRDKYKIYDVEPLDQEDDSRFRITLDESDDLLVIRNIVNHFGTEIFRCKWHDIRKYLIDNKDLLKINSHIVRNEGLIKDKVRIKN